MATDGRHLEVPPRPAQVAAFSILGTLLLDSPTHRELAPQNVHHHLDIVADPPTKLLPQPDCSGMPSLEREDAHVNLTWVGGIPKPPYAKSTPDDKRAFWDQMANAGTALGDSAKLFRATRNLDPSTVAKWLARYEEGVPKLSENRARRAGGGRKELLTQEQQDSVLALIDKYAPLSSTGGVGTVTLARLTAEELGFQVDAHTLSRSLTKHGELEYTLADEDVNMSEEQRDIWVKDAVEFIKTAYTWRESFFKLHSPSGDHRLECLTTAPRMISIDERPVNVQPGPFSKGHKTKGWRRKVRVDRTEANKQTKKGVDKQTITNIIPIFGNGDIGLPFFGLPNIKQPANSLCDVDGMPMFVVNNSTHFNNALAFQVYLRRLFSSLPSCGCGNPDCQPYFVGLDRASVHFDAGALGVLDELGIAYGFLSDTKFLQPGDWVFHGYLTDKTKQQMEEFLTARGVANQQNKKHTGEDLPLLSIDDQRQLTMLFTKRAL